MHDVKVVPISTQGIADLVEELGNMTPKERNELPKTSRLSKQYMFSMMQGPSIYDVLRWVYIIASLFHMTVGGDIKPYRRAFLFVGINRSRK